MSENIVEDKIYNEAFSRLSVLFEIKTKNLVATTRECATEFSILRTFYKMAEFILHNAYTNNFDKRADRLTAFWCQWSKNEHSKPPRIGVNTFQKTHSAIKIFYANMVHILNLKTGDELLKLLMANLRPLQKPNETAKPKNANKLENCDEIIEELNNMKWLENAILDDRIGLNMKEIYEKILEEFNNRRNSANTVEASIVCSSEFFKLHSINYLTQFVLEHIVQSALTSTSDLLYKMYRIEMEHLREAFNIFLHKYLGTVEDQIDISGGSDPYCTDDEDEEGGTRSVGTEQYHHMHQVGEGIEAEHTHLDKASEQVEEGIEVGGRLHLDGKMIEDDHHQQPAAAAGEGVEGKDRNELTKDVDQDTDNEYHDIEDYHTYHDNQSDDEITVEEYHDIENEQFQDEHQSEDGHDEKQ
uniref:Uncharacterized protein n=1 Tax=Globodera rostochiensis TaxID=31243 RepID=A0A914H1R6_GLORO